MSDSGGATALGGEARSALQTLTETARLFWSVADRYTYRRLLLALAAVSLGALAAALAPIALKFGLEALESQQTGNHIATAIHLFLLYAGGQLLLRCASDLRVMFHGHAEQRVRRHIGRRLFEHLVRLPLRFHLDRKTGAIGEAAEQGLRGFELLLQHLVYTLVPVCVEFTAVTIVLVRFGRESYLIILALTAAAYLLAFYRWAVSIHAPSERISACHIDAHAVLTDSLLNHETVKYFIAEPIVCRRYDVALGRTESAWRRFFSNYAVNGIAISVIFALSLGATLVLSAKDVGRGAMTVGDLVLVNAYVVRLVQPLEMLGLAVRDIAQGLAFLRALLAIFRERTEADAGVSRTPTSTSGALVFDHVTFGYNENRTILKDVSFCVPAGKQVAIVGVSGSGKSSLIRLLFRLYEPDRGKILLDGIPISEMSLSSVRQAIAIVPQDTVLFHDTIASNIGFGKSGAEQPEIEEAARLANLHDFIAELPEGYETVVGERGMKLSGGERQRVAIARAAMKKPRIFVCDEATSSLDTKSEREILRNLLDLSSHSTTLVIAHRLSTVVLADEIVVLDRGMVVERGTHQELLSASGHYAALWRAQQTSDQGDRSPSCV